MNIQKIRELAKIMSETGLTSLHLTEGVLDIHLERPAKEGAGAVWGKEEAADENNAQADRDSARQEEPAQHEILSEKPQENQELKTVCSPMVGVFYDSPSPDAPPFVRVGSKVKKGDVLCIIEAMKLMNEITAECDGEITAVCIKSGEVAEYGQTLFEVR